MNAAFPFHSGDAALLDDLLTWIEQMGGCKGHKALLVADGAVQWSTVLALKEKAEKSFDSVDVTTNRVPMVGWILGSNSLWTAAAEWFKAKGEPFWFNEPDCIPLKAGWLTDIETEYRSCGKPFMGAIIKDNRPFETGEYLEGNSVYPANAWDIIGPTINGKESWTNSSKAAVVPQAFNSPMVCHIWGLPDAAPTFVEKRPENSVNTFELSFLRPEWRVFHRSKDGSLLKLLRKRIGIHPKSIELVYLFPFCHMDWKLMLKSLQWMADLHGKVNRTAIIHTDSTVEPSGVNAIITAASRAFSNIVHSRYPNARVPGWPAACNWSFQAACRFINTSIKQPWFWFEADAVAVKRDWIEQIEQEYTQGGKPFMGTIIGNFDGLQMGHMNGVGVYPPDVPEYSDAIMYTVKQAWDTAWKDELGVANVAKLCHKANHLIQHCGAMVNGCCKPANGPLPHFPNMEAVKSCVEPTACVFHPCKSGTLIDRLRQQK